MTMIGTTDISSVDVSGLSFGERQGLARVLGGRVRRVEGRWRMLGGVRDDVRLDHPTVVRVLGEPLEAEAGTVRYEPDADEAERYAPGEGPLVLAYLARLLDERKAEYAVAVVNELQGGAEAQVPAGMRADLAAEVARRVRSLARRDALG